MDRSYVSLIAACIFFISATSILGDGCSPAEEEDGAEVTVHIFKNPSKEWLSSFQAEKTISNSTTGLIVNVKHSVVNLGPKYLVRVKGILRADDHAEELPPNTEEVISIKYPLEPKAMNNRSADSVGKLKFLLNKGRNADITDDRRSASRRSILSDSGHAGVITDRPLKDGELFQVQIDEVNDYYEGSGFYIGVIEEPQITVENRSCVCKIEDGVWTLYRGKIKSGQNTLQDDYPLTGINLQVYDRIGVMRKSDSSLHFFLNGTDMGRAATGIPPNVHGFVDIVNYVNKVSIVD